MRSSKKRPLPPIGRSVRQTGRASQRANRRTGQRGRQMLTDTAGEMKGETRSERTAASVHVRPSAAHDHAPARLLRPARRA